MMKADLTVLYGAKYGPGWASLAKAYDGMKAVALVPEQQVSVEFKVVKARDPPAPPMKFNSFGDMPADPVTVDEPYWDEFRGRWSYES